MPELRPYSIAAEIKFFLFENITYVYIFFNTEEEEESEAQLKDYLKLDLSPLNRSSFYVNYT